MPAMVSHQPKQIIFLTCDAFGIMPPISKLTPEQAMYHFISGYTAKVAGTEEGVLEPEATFSACFGAPFMVWHPYHYAEMLAAKLEKENCPCYLVNTGWVGGPYGTGSRCSLKYTRQLIDAIHDGTLNSIGWEEMPGFGVQLPTQQIKDVPVDILRPKEAWVSNGKTAEQFNDTANMQSDSSRKRSIPGINPLVDTVTLFLLKFNPFGSVIIFTAFNTFSVLCNGSPIPINTTFVTSSPAISLALMTCCTI